MRGRERTAVSVYAKNSGTYETAAAEEEKDTIRERACSSLTLLADTRGTKKKSLPSQIPEGGLMQRIKDRRLKILQHLQRSQEGGVTDLAGASTQVVKHRGRRNFRQHRAENCRNHRPIPQNCGYRQLIRCPKPEEKIRKIGKRRPIDGMAFRGTPKPINGPFSVVPRTKRRAPNQSRLLSHMPGETT